MTLDEFLQESRKQLDQFERTWKEGQVNDPDSFPSDLPEADWYEQFLSSLF